MLEELFSRSNLIGSYIIRAYEWGKWSHCALLNPSNGMVVESVFPGGVRILSFEEWKADPHRKAWTRRERQGLPESVWHRAASQEGKPYDKTGVLGMAFHRDWQDDSSWFCSELIEWAAQQEGCGVYVPEYVHRIGVNDRWRVR